MRLFSNVCWPAVLLSILLDPMALRAQQSDVPDEIELLRAERRAKAHAVAHVIPIYSIAGSDETSLYLLNLFADPLEVDVTAVSAAGTPFPLGRMMVEPTQHTRLELRQALAGAGAEHASGSLRLDLWGDAEMLQAWAVVERGPQAVEIPGTVLGKSTALALTSFWDARPLRGGIDAEPRFRFVNTGDEPLAVTFSIGHGPGPVQTSIRTLAPGAGATVEPLALSPGLRHGFLRAEHQGAAGSLVGAGLLEGRDFLSALPVRPPSEMARGYDAIRVPLGGGSETHVSLFNPADRPRSVDFAVLDAATGAALVERRETVAPLAVSSFDVRKLLAREATGDIRLHVAAAGPILAAGAALLPTGEAIDLALFGYGKGHPSGSYPLPPLADFEVVHTFLNLSSSPARIVAQISWSGGTYSLEPFDLPAGASRRLDVAQVAAAQLPDLLGRRLDPGYRNGFLQWTTQSGGHDVIARLEARRRGGRDVVGFNCSGCCTKTPRGSIMPSEVSFAAGETVLFQACETIYTCNSVLGPYPASIVSLSSPWPFTWNGTHLSASAGADAEISFTGEGEKLFTTCQVAQIETFGFGRGKTCQQTHNPLGYDPRKTCVSQTSSCDACKLCCEALKNQKICQGQAAHLVISEYNACIGHCVTDTCN